MKGKAMRKVLSLLIAFNLMFQQAGFAQGIAQLDISKYLGAFSGPEQFRPLQLRYFSYNPLTDNFQMLLDKGTLKKVEDSQLKEQGQELLKYFLVGVALPDENFWVNLRPDSEDEVISRELAETDVGKILLEADLQLKKDVARFTSPETAEGREYWDKLYKKAGELFLSSELTIPTLTRPWIVPGEVIIRENENSAYVYKGTLKVMLEQDHLKNSPDYNFKDPRLKELNEYSSELIRETIIPKLTKEVNSSKRYAALRQVFFSLILSRWFKNKFKAVGTVPTKEQIIDKQRGLTQTVPSYINLINSGDLTNLTSKEPWSKTTYFEAYKKSFAQGEYNLKEQVNGAFGPVIRSYFSGGITVANVTFTEGNQSALSFSGLRDTVSRVIKDRMVPLAESSSPATQPSAASPMTAIPSEADNAALVAQFADVVVGLYRQNAPFSFIDGEGRVLVSTTGDTVDNTLRQKLISLVTAARQQYIRVESTNGLIFDFYFLPGNPHAFAALQRALKDKFVEEFVALAARAGVEDAKLTVTFKSEGRYSLPSYAFVDTSVLSRNARLVKDSRSLGLLAEGAGIKFHFTGEDDSGSSWHYGPGRFMFSLDRDTFERLKKAVEAAHTSPDSTGAASSEVELRSGATFSWPERNETIEILGIESRQGVEGITFTMSPDGTQYKVCYISREQFLIMIIDLNYHARLNSQPSEFTNKFRSYSEQYDAGKISAASSLPDRVQQLQSFIDFVNARWFNIQFSRSNDMLIFHELIASPDYNFSFYLDGYEDPIRKREDADATPDFKWSAGLFISSEKLKEDILAGNIYVHIQLIPEKKYLGETLQGELTYDGRANQFQGYLTSQKEDSDRYLQGGYSVKLAIMQRRSSPIGPSTTSTNSPVTPAPSAASPITENSARINELDREKAVLGEQISRIRDSIASNDSEIANLEVQLSIPANKANPPAKMIGRKGYLETQNELSYNGIARIKVRIEGIDNELKRLGAGKASSPVAQGSIGQRQLTFAFIESLSGRKERPDKYVHHLRSNPFPDIPRFGTVQELQIQYRPNPQDRSSDYYEIRFFSDKSMNGHPKNPEMRFFSVNAYRNGKTDIYGIDGDPEELSAAIMKALQEYAETSNRHEDLVRALRQGVPSLDTSFIEKITSNKSRFYNYGYSLRSEPFPDIPKFGTVRKLQIQDQRNRDGNIAYYRIIFISDKGINSLSNSERLSFSINVYPNTTYDILIDRNVIGAAGGAEALAAAIMKALQEYGKASNSSEQLAWPLKEAMTADAANPDKGVALGTIIADLMERQRVVSNRPDAASSPVAQSVVKLENIIATLEAVIANISEGKEVDAENVARLLRLAYELKGRAKGFSLGITPFRRGTILFSEGSVYLVKEEYTKQVDPRYHSHGYVFDGWYWNPEEGLSTFQEYPVHGGIPVYSSTTTLTVNDIKALLFEQLSSLSLGNLSLRERLRWYTLWLEVGSADKDPQFDEKMGAWLRQNREFLLLIADQHGNKPVKRNTLIFDKESGSVTFVKNVIDNSVFGKKFQNGSWKDVLREPVPSGGMVTLETLQKLIVALDKEQQASSPVSALQGVVDEILKDTNTGQLSLTGNQREVIANALPEDRSKVIREIESRIIGNITVPFVYKGDNFEDLISQVPFGVINKPFIRRALSLRRTILRDAAQPKSGSPLTATTTEGVGGIDFRVITMITQPMGNLSGLNFSLPRLSNLENINLDEELGQIQRMLEAGIIPSGERLKEYVAACYQKGELKEHLDGIVGSLVDTCKLEEEKADVTSNALKEVMLILDSVS